MAEPLLSIRDLCVDYVTDEGPVRAVDCVSLDLKQGEILGIAGESGSGKTTMAKALLRILPPPAVITGGEVLFEGRDILKLSEPDLRALRWSRISMVFQSAMDALNPVISIGEQISDTMIAKTDLGPGEIRHRARELMEMVDIPHHYLDRHAHQLSGGMRQRVGIALALALAVVIYLLIAQVDLGAVICDAAADGTGVIIDVSPTPAVGQGWFFLLRDHTTPGDYGLDSAGRDRVPASCLWD